MSNNMEIMGRSRNSKFKTPVTSEKAGSMRLDGIRRKTPMMSPVQKSISGSCKYVWKEKTGKMNYLIRLAPSVSNYDFADLIL